MTASDSLGQQFRYDELQDDDPSDGAHSVSSDLGHIKYSAHEGSNGIWGASSSQRGHGSVLFDEMMKRHPAQSIHYGDVTPSGDAFARKQVTRYPDVKHYRAVRGADVQYRRPKQ